MDRVYNKCTGCDDNVTLILYKIWKLVQTLESSGIIFQRILAPKPVPGFLGQFLFNNLRINTNTVFFRSGVSIKGWTSTNTNQ